jgi:hypothetical protein
MTQHHLQTPVRLLLPEWRSRSETHISLYGGLLQAPPWQSRLPVSAYGQWHYLYLSTGFWTYAGVRFYQTSLTAAAAFSANARTGAIFFIYGIMLVFFGVKFIIDAV